MQKLIVLFAVFILVLTTTQPASSSDENQLQPASPGATTTARKIVFVVTYENWAWGHQKDAFVIDNAGNVIKAGQITPEEKILKLPVEYKIDDQELENRYVLVKKAAEGKITQKDGKMRDSGGVRFEAYWLNNQPATSSKVLLAEIGDLDLINEAPQAKQLVEWLVEIAYRIKFAPHPKLQTIKCIVDKAANATKVSLKNGQVLQIELELGRDEAWKFENFPKDYFELVNVRTQKINLEKISDDRVLKIWELRVKKTGSAQIQLSHYKTQEGQVEKIESFLIETAID